MIVIPNPNGNGNWGELSLCEFIAMWINWQINFDNEIDEENALNAWIPQGKCSEGISAILALPENRAVRRGLDLMLRILLGEGCYNARWVTDHFFNANRNWLQVGDRPVGVNGRFVRSAGLTDAARKYWNENCDNRKEILLSECESLINCDQDYCFESEDKEDACEGMTFSLTGTVFLNESNDFQSNPCGMTRDDLLKCLVNCIQHEEFQPYYRRNAYGNLVRGWPARLQSYFWPKPVVGLTATNEKLAGLTARLSGLLAAIDADGWCSSVEREAICIAKHIFIWGGVYASNRNSLTVENIKNVIESSREGIRVNGAPMNSAWTKLAAMVSMADPDPSVTQQAIWDSRVSHSLIKRIDFCSGRQDVRDIFPDLGWVPGRGGTRIGIPEYSVRWPDGYRSWESHFAAAKIINQIVDILNGNLTVYGSPGGSGGQWTVREVEMVLFMDGY